jgi:hypothetical protein
MDKFLGTEPFVLAAFDVNQAVGTFFADRSVQNEATGNWIGRKLGQQYNHRRHVYVVFNGARRGTIYEDAQQPNGDMLDEYFPNDNRGELRKIEDWFEFGDNGQTFTVNTRLDIGSQSASLFRVNDNSGGVDSKRYRWTFRPRSTDNPNDWFSLTNLVVAMNTPGNGPDYYSNVLAWVDVRNWLRPIATHHLCGDWDSYGYERGKNMYAYISDDHPEWRLLIWDIELGLGHSQSRSPIDGIYRNLCDPTVGKMFTNAPPFQREYLCALLEGCNGPMAPGVADVLLDARYASFVQNNLPVITPDYIKSFMAARREYILAQIPSAPFTMDGPTFFETTNAVITFSGLAPVSVKDIVLSDGRNVALTWTTITNWMGNVRIAPGTNVLVFRALNANGIEVASVTVTSVFNGVYPWPPLKINEWMASNGGFIRDPADNDADDWFELYNPTDEAVDINGWYLSDTPTNKTQYLVPSSYVVPAGGYLFVWADGEPLQNGPGAALHVNFQLRAAGEDIVLTAPDGTVVDHVTFGQQTNNISQGRSPDGSATILYQFTPTPDAANYYVVPVISDVAVTNGVATFTFTTTPGHNYRVEYKNNFAETSWTPLIDQAATGGSIVITDPVGANSQRFYRARSLD